MKRPRLISEPLVIRPAKTEVLPIREHPDAKRLHHRQRIVTACVIHDDGFEDDACLRRHRVETGFNECA